MYFRCVLSMSSFAHNRSCTGYTSRACTQCCSLEGSPAVTLQRVLKRIDHEQQRSRMESAVCNCLAVVSHNITTSSRRRHDQHISGGCRFD